MDGASDSEKDEFSQPYTDESSENDEGMDLYCKAEQPKLRSYLDHEAQPTISPIDSSDSPQLNADLIGDEIEKFAENLDRLNLNKVQKPQKDCRLVLPLVQAYRKIARERVRALKREHTSGSSRRRDRKPKRKSQTPDDSSQHRSSENFLETAPTVELKKWQQEEQTWDLLGLMLQVKFPVPEPQRQEVDFDEPLRRPSRDSEIHRYCSEKEVWNHFLAHDNLAWERHTVVEWLKKCADNSEQDISLVVKNLEKEADRGDGLWAHSWLYSKEAIKLQKRLRSWPQSLTPDSPGIETSLTTSERKPLVTQLDPDAITRQGRNLEAQDLNFERATWLACWEMVRRGKSWEFIRDWCQERVDGWRSIAMRGDPRQYFSTISKRDDNSSLTTGWQSRVLWRKTCALNGRKRKADIAQSGIEQRNSLDDYEAAVYGILGGHLPSVQRVCGSWNDYLFAHYNSYLVSSFDRYIASTFPERLPAGITDKDGIFHSVTGCGRTQSSKKLVEKLKTIKRIAKSAKQPFKMLQGSLVGQTFGDFAFEQGVQLSLHYNTDQKRSKLIPPMTNASLEEGVDAIGKDDCQMLRVMTHIILIFKCLGLNLKDDYRSFARENFIVAYMDYLSRAGKQQILPLYASCLSPKRAVNCLGGQLPFIVDNTERVRIMRLMKQNRIDVLGVLGKQLQLILVDFATQQFSNDFPNLVMLEESEKEKGTQSKWIRNNFLGNPITDDQRNLISGFEWYLLLDGHWQQTMATGVILYKFFLKLSCLHGLAAGSELSRRVSFKEIWERKKKTILGQKDNLSETVSGDHHKLVEGPRGSAEINNYYLDQRQTSLNQRSSTEQELLLEQSVTFRDFENLFRALDAMGKWERLIADENLGFGRYPTSSGAQKNAVRGAYSKVEDNIQPLLYGWLQHPEDDEEAIEFAQIRAACLPEVVLSYVHILSISARYVSRDLLIRSMDLLNTIAGGKSDVADSFISSGRISELADSFAVLGTAALAATENSGKSNPKLGIWSIKPPPTAEL
ncbi:MAG: hypothetical protein Q9167_006508 [Letrouitia subvulpina]